MARAHLFKNFERILNSAPIACVFFVATELASKSVALSFLAHWLLPRMSDPRSANWIPNNEGWYLSGWTEMGLSGIGQPNTPKTSILNAKRLL